MEPTSSRTWALVGLAIALFGIPATVVAQRLLASDPSAATSIVARELAILSLTAFLLWITRSRERLSFGSIGIGTQPLGRSLAWGAALALVSFAAVVACLAIYSALGIHYGAGSAISRSLPVTLLTVARAGVSEEIFYRGYAIERLESLSGSKWIAAAASLAAFAGFHYRQGIAGIGLALMLGAVITGFYLWKRNLVAVMFAHFLVDFVPNVLLPLLGAAN